MRRRQLLGFRESLMPWTSATLALTVNSTHTHAQFNIETVIVVSTLGAYVCVFVLYSYQRASQDLQFFLLIFNFISLRQQVTNMQ